jgi:hypothetical protein
MTKRSTRSVSSHGEELARSPSRRGAKHSKDDSSDATTDSNSSNIVENDMSGLNLLDITLNASTAEVKLGDVCDRQQHSLNPHSFFDISKALKEIQDAYSCESDDEGMEGYTAKTATEASADAKETAKSATPVKKVSFARLPSIRKEKIKTNPQLRQPKKKGNESRQKKIALSNPVYWLDSDKTKSNPQLQQPKKKWNESRKFRSFIKIRTAKLTTVNRLDQETEFMGVMQATLAKLWTLDPKLVIFPWKKGLEDSKPIQKGKAFPSNRTAFADFTEKIFLKRGESVWIRLHVGHNKEITALKDDRMVDHFRKKEMLVYKDNLQVKTTAKAGWLLGSHTTVLNPRDLEAALALLPEMSGLPVEIRIEWISIAKGDKLSLKAAHILCARDSTFECRRALDKIYGENVDDHPLGRKMRFVPNISDMGFLTTGATRKMVEKSVKEQRLFTTQVSSAISYMISDLDSFDSTIGKTLRQALMQMRSKQFPDQNLFLAVDTSWNGSFVSFLFKKDLEAEVNGILPALPLVLQHKMGATVWNWFNEEAHTSTAGYWWCPKKGVKAVGDEDDDSWGGFDLDADTIESDDATAKETETRTVNESLSAAQRAWRMHWDRGKTVYVHGERRNKQEKKKKKARKTKTKNLSNHNERGSLCQQKQNKKSGELLRSIKIESCNYLCLHRMLPNPWTTLLEF